ncbi:protein PFC0760c-like [Ruditapes philippinarum]|uniref:protein PFC0760c-like n=1 Tax=Ruditapes philippinarum TaxID=129788 RepID=UPI00295C1593|nr:protein PFC0760c-like [Ruditapes philippinarum]
MPFKCDICNKEYAYKRNLKRHSLEKHIGNKKWSCSEKMCSSKFSRRSNLVRHLCLTHKYSAAKARRVALDTDKIKSKKTTATCTYYEDVSSDESILDLHAELDAMEEEEAIRYFDLEPYEEDTVDYENVIKQQITNMDVKNDSNNTFSENENANDINTRDVVNEQKLSDDEYVNNLDVIDEVNNVILIDDEYANERCSNDVENDVSLDYDDDEYIEEEVVDYYTDVSDKSVVDEYSDDEDDNDDDEYSEEELVDNYTDVSDISVVDKYSDDEDDNIIVVSEDESELFIDRDDNSKHDSLSDYEEEDIRALEPSRIITKYKIHSVTVVQKFYYLDNELVGMATDAEQDYHEYTSRL